MATPLPDDDTFLARWLSGDLTAAEQAAFADHPDRAAYERIVAAGGQLSTPEYDVEAELRRLKGRRKELLPPATVETKATVRRLSPYYWSAAAAVAILLASWFFWPQGSTQLMAGNGQTTTTTLPDGSGVVLNAGSELSFTTGEQRHAELSGEAFFEVEKSAVPFVVTTARGTVTVLGTSFNVYARDETLQVACKTGRVAVTFAGLRDTVILTPGRMVSRTNDGRPVETELDGNTVSDWQNGRSTFRRTPLRTVIGELERQHDITVVTPAGFDLDQQITTTFSNDGDPTEALRAVLNPLPGINFRLEGRTVTIEEQ